jgi:hypothetical protein
VLLGLCFWDPAWAAAGKLPEQETLTSCADALALCVLALAQSLPPDEEAADDEVRKWRWLRPHPSP